MSAAGTALSTKKHVRKGHRFDLAVPIDITVLRSGVPDSIPGRATNVCEGGLGAVVAGELRPGDRVGVEFRLPFATSQFHAKAIVRYEARLQCGMEFQGLSQQQRDTIRYWGLRNDDSARSDAPAAPAHENFTKPQRAPKRRLRGFNPRTLWIVLAALTLLAGLGWWQWYSTWNELEAALPSKQLTDSKDIPKIPASQMEQLVTHRVDPIYPDAARHSKLQGVVLIDMLVGPDGSVVDLHPVSGPAVLTAAAADAVRWWRFQPYRVNGQAVAVETTMAVDFRP